MARKKQILLFVCDGFRDHEISAALNSINQTNQFSIRTIAIDKGIKRSSAGLSVLPDLDFIPEVDLKDIDSFYTALLILPGANTVDEKTKYKISILVDHCFGEGIPMVVSKDLMCQLPLLPARNITVYEHESDCRSAVFNKLHIHRDHVLSGLQYEGIMFG